MTDYPESDMNGQASFLNDEDDMNEQPYMKNILKTTIKDCNDPEVIEEMMHHNYWKPVIIRGTIYYRTFQ